MENKKFINIAKNIMIAIVLITASIYTFIFIVTPMSGSPFGILLMIMAPVSIILLTIVTVFMSKDKTIEEDKIIEIDIIKMKAEIKEEVRREVFNELMSEVLDYKYLKRRNFNHNTIEDCKD